MGLLFCSILAVIFLLAILDHDDDGYEEEFEEESDPTLVGDRITILIRLPHDKE